MNINAAALLAEHRWLATIISSAADSDESALRHASDAAPLQPLQLCDKCIDDGGGGGVDDGAS